ncbi:hypothetical protein AAFF_G00353040 [Aldrovandia affinis]|uniref:Uncharacterized protein n=1 Tax=Aldrovandia affinis TaxID=143900 RepID=A0AAD7SJ10_9TELE|nr:hypothetical protein AAFF_G00353040 [Aldrovandia affinis]
MKNEKRGRASGAGPEVQRASRSGVFYPHCKAHRKRYALFPLGSACSPERPALRESRAEGLSAERDCSSVRIQGAYQVAYGRGACSPGPSTLRAVRAEAKARYRPIVTHVSLNRQPDRARGGVVPMKWSSVDAVVLRAAG